MKDRFDVKITPRFAIWFIDPETKDYVFCESGPDREQMQRRCEIMGNDYPKLKPILLVSHHPQDRIDPYHQQDYKPIKAFA